MKKYKSIRGTQDSVNVLERDSDRVYVRSNIRRIDDIDTKDNIGFHGWEYDEEVYSHIEHIHKMETEIEVSRQGSLTAMEGIAEIYESLVVNGGKV